jgi:hypothetical protein
LITANDEEDRPAPNFDHGGGLRIVRNGSLKEVKIPDMLRSRLLIEAHHAVARSAISL